MQMVATSNTRENSSIATRRAKRSIYEKEQPTRFAEQEPFPAELIGFLEKDVGKGVSMDPRDSIWWGGKSEFDLDSKLREVSYANGAIEVVRSMIGAKRLADFRSPERKKRKSLHAFRLERALEPITGEPVPLGASTLDLEDAARRAAPEYFEATLNPQDKRTETAILQRAMWPDGPPKDLNSQDIANKLKPLKKYFRRHKDRMLLSHSAVGLPEFDYAADCVRDAVAKLAEVGLASAPYVPTRAQ